MCTHPTLIRDKNNPYVNGCSNYLAVPCGKCIECRLEYTNTFAIRMMHESLSHSKNCFLTLTYNDEGMQKSQDEYNKFIDESIDKLLKSCPNLSREQIEILHFTKADRNIKSLHKRDAQNFLKRLRKRYVSNCPFNPFKERDKFLEWQDKESIRYFLCGEYGGTFGRKHFHCILFNFYPDDVYYDKLSHRHRSPTLEQIWPYGFIDIGNVTYQSARYVSSYIVKQKFGRDTVFYDVNNLSPEFVLMSQGIGRPYLRSEEHKKQLKSLGFIICNSHKSKMPRYYENKLYDENERKERNELKSQFLKKARETFEESLEYLDYLRDSRKCKELHGHSYSFGEWCERKYQEKLQEREKRKQELVNRKRKEKKNEKK